MMQLFKATLYRMYKSTGVRIAVLFTYVAAIGYYVLGFMIANGDMEAEMAGNVTALGDAMIIWLFGSLVVGVLVGGDFESKTIHGAIGYGRKAVVMNYVFVYMAMMVVLLLPYITGSIALIIAGVDMTGAEGTTVSIFMDNIIRCNGLSDGINVGKLILSYVSYTVVIIGQLSILIIVAMKLRKAMPVTCVGFIFGMLTALLALLASKVEILDNIYKLTPYNYSISRLGMGADISDMLRGIVVSLVFMAFCGEIGWLAFRKADIK